MSYSLGAEDIAFKANIRAMHMSVYRVLKVYCKTTIHRVLTLAGRVKKYLAGRHLERMEVGVA